MKTENIAKLLASFQTASLAITRAVSLDSEVTKALPGDSRLKVGKTIAQAVQRGATPDGVAAILTHRGAPINEDTSKALTTALKSASKTFDVVAGMETALGLTKADIHAMASMLGALKVASEENEAKAKAEKAKADEAAKLAVVPATEASEVSAAAKPNRAERKAA